MDNQTLFTKLNQIKSLSEECLATLSNSSMPKRKLSPAKETKKEESEEEVKEEIKDGN